jgi:putative ABC transport system substrate-binding protein
MGGEARDTVMRRRDFLGVLAPAIVVTAGWPVRVPAQQASLPVIGILHSGAAHAFKKEISVLLQGLKDGGYTVGQNVEIEYRWAESRPDTLPRLAADLVHRRVAVILAIGGNAPALAAKAATRSIPVVFNTGADPVRAGLVKSMNRPEGNVTGVSFLVEQTGGKVLGLLREVVPAAGTLGFLINPRNPNAAAQVADAQGAAQALRVHLRVIEVAQAADLESAFQSMVDGRIGGLSIGADTLFASAAPQIIALAAQHRIPLAYYRREFAEAGALMGYGPSVAESYAQAGVYAARILKGARPQDLPVFQVVRFEFVLNLKTAKMLNLDIPPGLSARADAIVE